MDVDEKTSRVPWKRILLFGMIGGLLGALIAFGIGYGIAFQWFVFWEELPRLDIAAVIAGATVNTVDVATDSGELYRFDTRESNPRWMAVEHAETETDGGCEPFARARPLRRVKQQQLVCKDYADGGVTAIYALREDGSLWAWQASDSAYSVLLMLVCPVIGLPVGLVLGMLTGVLTRRRARAQSIRA